MKKTLFVLSFLLLNSFLCSVAEQPKPVLDFDGNEVRTGEQYYFLPSGFGFQGGLTLGRPVNLSLCPRTVVQALSEVNMGTPVTFTPVNPKDGVIRVSTDLNVQFNAPSFCRDSNVWKLDLALGIGKYIIFTNGVKGDPGCETASNWFKIEEYGTDYKLVFCPTVCETGRPICGDFGIYVDQDGTQRLAFPTLEPFRFLLTKAERTDE